MGLGEIFGKVLGSGIKETAEGVVVAAKGIRQAITGELSEEGKLKLADMEQSALNLQAKINEIEAASSSLFVAGWRPALGWVGVGCIGLYFGTRIVLGMFFWSMAAWKAQALLPMPEMGIGDIIGLVCTLLGTAGLRSIDKYNGK